MFLKDNLAYIAVSEFQESSVDKIAESNYRNPHEILGHVHAGKIRKIYPTRDSKMPYHNCCDCDVCLVTKMRKQATSKASPALYQPGHKTHTDTAGPFIPGLRNEKYFSVFVDNATRYIVVEVLNCLP